MGKYSRWLPLRQATGKHSYIEVYGDPRTGEVYKPRAPDGEYLGWKGEPPNQPSGEREREATEGLDHDAYRRGWERIFHKECDDATE